MNEKGLRKLMTVQQMLDNLSLESERLNYKLDGYSSVPKSFYDEAVKVLKIANNLVEYLEDTDENMEVGAIEPVDKYFENNPITDYVNATLDFLQGKISKEEAVKLMGAAAEKIEGNHSESEPEPEKEQEIKAEEDLANRVVADLGFSEEQAEYKKKFTKFLIDAVNHLQDRSGMTLFQVYAGNNELSGTMSSNNGNVSVTINDKTYYLREAQAVADEAYCTGNPYTCGRDYCGCTDEEPFCPCDCDCEYDCCEDMELIDYVREFEEEVKSDTLKVMDSIEDYLKGKKDFTSDDIELIRFFLRNLPQNSDYDIEELSDRAVVLAWKQRKYRQGL